jgi:hypothetical protein
MKTLTFSSLLAILLILGACGGNTPKTENSGSNEPAKEQTASGKHKYGIKSGIIEYNTSTMGTNVIQTLYFDDYGAKEANEMQMEIAGMKSHTLNIVKEGFTYTLDLNSKTGTKARLMGTPNSNIDFENISEEILKQMKMKKEGHEDFQGKTCEKYTMDNSDMQMKGTFLVWKGIALKSEMAMSTIKTTMVAKNFQENANVPAEKFDVPSDFQITEQ